MTWNSFVQSTLHDLRNGSEVPEYFGNLIPLVSRPTNLINKIKMNHANFTQEDLTDDDLLNLNVVKIQQPQNQINQLQNNISNIQNQYNNESSQHYNSNSPLQQQNNGTKSPQQHKDMYEEEENQTFNENYSIEKINENIENDENDEIQQLSYQSDQSQQFNNESPEKDYFGDNESNGESPSFKSASPQFTKNNKDKQKQFISDSPKEDSFMNNEPNTNSEQEEQPKVTEEEDVNEQNEPETPKQNKAKQSIPETPETPEIVEFPESGSDSWQEVPKKPKQPIPAESLLNDIDVEDDNKDNHQEEEEIAEDSIPIAERFRMLSGGLYDRYWSPIPDCHIARLNRDSRLFVTFKVKKFKKLRKAMRNLFIENVKERNLLEK